MIKYQPFNFLTIHFTHFKGDDTKIMYAKSFRFLYHFFLHEFHVMENQLILMSGNTMLATLIYWSNFTLHTIQGTNFICMVL
jgi:hypothetical protein